MTCRLPQAVSIELHLAKHWGAADAETASLVHCGNSRAQPTLGVMFSRMACTFVFM